VLLLIKPTKVAVELSLQLRIQKVAVSIPFTETVYTEGDIYDFS
jgi:hypothetical protein